LREGKRTLLVAFMRELGTPDQVGFLEAALGHSDLTDDDVARVREDMTACGALAAVETEIDSLSSASFTALDELRIPDLPRQALRYLAESAVQRSS
ncbi:MAG: polyprenyl synthetase family protein, partial [Arthrobacter sp.]|nr:polyprenyl synthetase family protein [Arthrobacter sp.]